MSQLEISFGKNAAYAHTLYWLQRTVAITGISLANPAVITTAEEHGLRTGDWINLFETNCYPDAEGGYQATRLSATTFSVPLNVDLKAGNAGMVGVPVNLFGYVFTGEIDGGIETARTTTAKASTKQGSRHVQLRAESPSALDEFEAGELITVEGAINSAKILGIGELDSEFCGGGYIQNLYLEGAASATVESARCSAIKSVRNYSPIIVSNTQPLLGQIDLLFPAMPTFGIYDFSIFYAVGSGARQLFVCDQFEVKC